MEQSEFNKRVNRDIQEMMGTLDLNEHMVLESNNMVCKHCNTKQQLKMPTTFDDLEEVSAKFMAVHTHCITPKGESPAANLAKDAVLNAVNEGYQTGFDHGCDYLVNEAEYWVRTDKGTLAEFVQYMKDFKKG